MMRQCGDCNLCCKLLPVVPLGKGANERCVHQRHTGCRVYHKPDMPHECALWNCRWLVDRAGGTSRPDRSRIVIDVMPDFIDVNDNETGNKFPIEVIQCWIDPQHPEAHKDRAFRAFLFEQAKEGRFALIRLNAKDAFVLVAPETEDGEWRELGGASSGRTHTPIEIMQALS